MRLKRTLDDILEEVRLNTLEGARQAADWLAEELRADVSLACPAVHGGGDNHSPLGGPPYLESGEGRDSIDTRDTDDGAEVFLHGTVSGQTLPEGNQLAYWDTHGRPWLKGESGDLWKKKYGNVIRNIIAISAKRHVNKYRYK